MEKLKSFDQFYGITPINESENDRISQLKKDIFKLNTEITTERYYEKRQLLMLDRDIKKCLLRIVELKAQKEVLKRRMGLI
jgi:hypothetical protein